MNYSNPLDAVPDVSLETRLITTENQCIGQDSWEREENLACARVAVEGFWIALEEPMPDSEVFRKKKRGRQKTPTPTTACKKRRKRNRRL